MRDHNRRASSKQSGKVILDRAFGFGIQRARCLVKDQHRWIVIDRSRDGDALFLTAGEGKTAFSNLCLITKRQTHDELVSGGSLASCKQAINIRLRVAKRNIPRDRIVKHVIFLKNGPDLSSDVAIIQSL